MLGFPPGQDKALADWTQTVVYLQNLALASPRVRTDTVGLSTEGRPFLLVTISSEKNMRRLEEIRRVHLRLADPRGLSAAQAERLIEQDRMVVVLTHGIHATEVAGAQTALETAWLLASTQDPDLLKVLDETVILLVPSQNPDGAQKVVEWYRRTLGTPFEAAGCESGCRLPFLYHHYVGHDNNRDWYAFTQVETRVAVEGVLRRWHPVVLHDVHQMGTRGPRLFVPPYMEPWEPNVDPALRAETAALGTHMAATLTAAGKKGVVTDALFDAWTPARAYTLTHAGVRILSETAGGRLASPLEVPADTLEAEAGVDARVAAPNFPQPWPGGTWRLRDQMDYQLGATRALLGYASAHRREMLRTFWEVGQRASQRARPYAFVVPVEQRDPAVARRLLEILREGEVELHRTRRPLTLGGRTLAAGAAVVLMKQPASAFAKTVLERQQYPDLRVGPGGPPRRPYDATAHTLPLLMGVDVLTAEEPFSVPLVLVERLPPPRATWHPGRGAWLALPHTVSGFEAASRLLKTGLPVQWAGAAVAQGADTVPAGAFLVPSSARRQVAVLAAGLGLEVRPVEAPPDGTAPLRAPRVGLYQSWNTPMDEGWTRYVFEKQLELPYRTLHDEDVRKGALRAEYDVIVLPDQAPGALLEGNPPGSLPAQYTGGLGKEGAAALRAFVEAGGTLLAFDGATRFAIQELGLPVRDALSIYTRPGRRTAPEAATEQGASEFYAPGSLLEARPALDDPLLHGVPPAVAVWFESSPGFVPGPGVKALLRYPDTNPLLSGWLIGPEKLAGLAALVDAPLGSGHVLLFGFRPQYRAQSWGTYVLLLNALYRAALEPAPAPAGAAAR